MSNYLIHSKKGTTWKNHKYLRIENGKYIYEDSKTIEDAAKKVESGAYGSDLHKALGKNYGIVTSKVASGFKKPSSKSSSKSKTTSKVKTQKDSTKSSKSSTKNSTKETTVKNQNENKTVSEYDSLHSAVNKLVNLSDKDSYTAVKNDDGSTNVMVEFEDGSTQSIVLDKYNNVIDYTEKTMKHSDNDHLMHYGLSGMKWGTRRWQYKDGRFNEAGKIRYFGKGNSNNSKNEDDSRTAKVKNEYDKNDAKGKYDKYKELGLSKEDQIAAKTNSDKVKKAAMIAGGIVLTGAAVYLGRQYIANNIDTLVKSGKTLQTIMDTDAIDTGRQFYTSIHGLDKLRYGAINAQQGGYSKVHKLTVGKDFKIASNNSAGKVFEKLVKSDNDFADEVFDMLEKAEPFKYSDATRGKAIRKALKEVQKDRFDKNAYNIFNVQLAGEALDDNMKNKFYDALKKAGYAGVKDVNDVKYTNYRSITPAIIFDGIDKFKDVKVSELNNAHYKAGSAIVVGQGIVNHLLLKPAIAYTGISTYKKIKASYTDPELVAQYRKEHPNSTATYDEILKTLKKK